MIDLDRIASTLQAQRLAQTRAAIRDRLWRDQQARLWECAIVWERLEMEAQQAAQA